MAREITTGSKKIKRQQRKHLKKKQKKKPFKPETFEPPRHQPLILAAIGLFAFLLYVNTFSGDYIMDDIMLITKNKFTTKGFSGIPDILTNDISVGYFGRQINMSGIHYRPLPQIIFAIQYEFFGLNPIAGHISNAFFYAICCMLLFTVLARIFFRSKDNENTLIIPLFATLIFTAHPIHTEVVANIKSLDEILALIGGLGCLYFCLRYVSQRKVMDLFWSGILFFIGLTSKENALTFLLIIPLTLYFFRQPERKVYVHTLLPAAIFSLIYFQIRTDLIQEGSKVEYVGEFLVNPYIGLDIIERFPTVIFSWGKYLLLLFFPLRLTNDYFPFHFPLQDWSDYGFLISLIAITLIGFFVIKGFKHKSVLSYGVLFFFICFSITSNLLFFAGAPMSERFMFMPSVGFSLVLAFLIVTVSNLLFKDDQLKFRFGAIMLALIVIGFSYKTFDRNFDWKNQFTLFTTDVKASQQSSKCNVSAAYSILSKIGEIEDKEEKAAKIALAEKYALQAISIIPDNYQAYRELIRISNLRNDTEKANYYSEIYNRLKADPNKGVNLNIGKLAPFPLDKQ